MLEKTSHPDAGLTRGPQLRQVLDQIGQIIPLADALEDAPRVLAGLTRGRVVVKVLD